MSTQPQPAWLQHINRLRGQRQFYEKFKHTNIPAAADPDCYEYSLRYELKTRSQLYEEYRDWLDRLPPGHGMPTHRPRGELLCLDRLPHEVLEIIMSNVKDQQYLANASLVSKGIGAIAQAELYKHIEIKDSIVEAEASKRVLNLLRTLSNAGNLASLVQTLALPRITSESIGDENGFIAEPAFRFGLSYERVDYPACRGSSIGDIFKVEYERSRMPSYLVSLILLCTANLRELRITEHGVGPFWRSHADVREKLGTKLSKLKKIEVTRYPPVLSAPSFYMSWCLHVPSIRELSLVVQGDYNKELEGFVTMEPGLKYINPFITKLESQQRSWQY